MSAFRDYIVDFPKRGQDILKHLEPHAKGMDREVTLMLMIASSSFLVPHERLGNHPSNDSTRFGTSLLSFNKDINVIWAKSGLSKNVAEWQYGLTPNIGNGPDGWQVIDTNVSKKNVSEVLAIIRNALAHGNLFTEGDPIRILVFYSENRFKNDNCNSKRDGYKFLKVPVEGFKQFLLNWFDLLDNIKTHVSYREILDELREPHEFNLTFQLRDE